METSENNVNKLVKVTLMQGEKLLEVEKSIGSNTISELSGTITARIFKIQEITKKHKIKTGISFFRKFEIKVQIDETSLTLNNLLGVDSIRFTATMNNENAKLRMASLINDLVEAIMIEAENELTDYTELIEEIEHSLVENVETLELA